MLSEFITLSGYHPKYAVEILNREEAPLGKGRGEERRFTTTLRGRH